jgi:NAD(P)-dependent dehydrogenase (short-subunit alcohol dehydrogenase family)
MIILIIRKEIFMQGKKCLITGATSGIGEAIALALAQKGAEVIIVSRNEEKCARIVSQIQEQSGNSAITYFQADLSSQQAIRLLAAEVNKKYSTLDVLVNNAGAFFWKRRESVDGIEMTFALNHLNYFLLTNLLLDLLRKTPSARIVNTSSGSHNNQVIDFNDLQLKKNYLHFRAYGKSKLANLYFTYELSRRLNGSGITVNAFSPGFTKSNISKEGNLAAQIFMPLTNIFSNPTEQGADSGVYLASSPEVESITGKYYFERKSIPSSDISYDEVTAQRLWNISEELTGLI